MGSDKKIYKPQKGFQEKFVRSNVDVVIGGGAVGVGKSMAACLCLAEPMKDPNFRAVFLRKQATDTKVGGGLLDDLKTVYGEFTDIRESGSNPRVTFPWGSFVDLSHTNEENPEKLLERVKGWQYDLIYFDEGTGFEWNTFLTIMSRNRGKSKWTGKIRMTTNPKKSHWLRTFLDWYIAPDGYIDPAREGVVRYFYVNGKSVKDVVWGDTKQEVYRKCQVDIDRKLRRLGKGFAYENMIKSFTFYLGNLSENKAVLENNKGYVGSVAAMGGAASQANLEGNWNVDPDGDGNAPFDSESVLRVFYNDEMRNNDRWITCDLADVGSDNFIAVVWDGFHIIDIDIMCKSTPRKNTERLKLLAHKYDIADCHIIYDATRAVYVNDDIEDAIPFLSSNSPRGIYGRAVVNLKDECYFRLMHVINNDNMSVSESVAQRDYVHQNISNPISIQAEFMEECSVVRFREQANGKKRLFTKKEMNAMLGKGRSMDLLDPCAMRMLPILEYNIGEELSQTANLNDEEEELVGQSIYDETLWS